MTEKQHNKYTLSKKEVSIIDLKLPAGSPLGDGEDMPVGYSFLCTFN
jgi:hypothetical protein|tara:strand:- start:232 stop:372 length:141 start_codon:yes stop_codon:yes gene_type:complete